MSDVDHKLLYGIMSSKQRSINFRDLKNNRKNSKINNGPRDSRIQDRTIAALEIEEEVFHDDDNDL